MYSLHTVRGSSQHSLGWFTDNRNLFSINLSLFTYSPLISKGSHVPKVNGWRLEIRSLKLMKPIFRKWWCNDLQPASGAFPMSAQNVLTCALNPSEIHWKLCCLSGTYKEVYIRWQARKEFITFLSTRLPKPQGYNKYIEMATYMLIIFRFRRFLSTLLRLLNHCREKNIFPQSGEISTKYHVLANNTSQLSNNINLYWFKTLNNTGILEKAFQSLGSRQLKVMELIQLGISKRVSQWSKENLKNWGH